MKLVTAIMPTRARPQLAGMAVECFLDQDYPAKELLILDDADSPSFPGGLDLPGVRYHVTERRSSIPHKRNQLCRMATGELIAHWDSDDWNHPCRLSHQVGLLQQSSKSVAAYRTLLFHGPESDSVYRYIGAKDYGLGTSLMYTQDWWRRGPFKENKFIGEDSEMIYRAADANEIISVDGEGYIVARVHEDNTARKRVWEKEYRPLTIEALPAGYPR